MTRVLISMLTLLLVIQEPAKLQPGPPVVARIHGRVLENGSGRPVVKMLVSLLSPEYTAEAVLQRARFDSVLTDEHGEYAFAVKSVGRYMLATSSMADGIPYIPQTYPATPDQSTAKWLYLSEGDAISGIDLTVSRGRLVSVRGQFIDGLAHRYPHWDYLWLESRNLSGGSLPARGGGHKVRYINAKGFELRDVPSGLYYLMSYRFDEIVYRAETVIPIEVRDQDLEVDVVSEGSHRLNGRFRFDGPKFSLQKPIVELSLRSLSGAPSSTPFATFFPGGIWSFSPLPSGSYRLSILGVPPPFYVKYAGFGTEQNVLEKGITLPRPDSESLEIAIGSNGAQIQGSVESGIGAAVVLIPNTRALVRPDLYKVAKVNPTGQFEMGGIAPGAYRLFAWKDVSSGQYFDEEYLRRYQGKGTPIQLGPGASLHVDLRLLD